MGSRGKRWAVALLLTLISGCALPAAPKAPQLGPPCPSLRLLSIEDEDLIIGLSLPERGRVPGTPLAILKGAGRDSLASWTLSQDQVEVLNQGDLLRLPLPMPTSEAPLLLYAAGVDATCQLAPFEVHLRDPAGAPPKPQVKVHGTTVEIHVPLEVPYEMILWRRALSGEEVVLSERWEGAIWVDTTATPGAVYAYSVTPLVRVESEREDFFLPKDRGPESYAALPSLDRLVTPPEAAAP